MTKPTSHRRLAAAIATFKKKNIRTSKKVLCQGLFANRGIETVVDWKQKMTWPLSTLAMEHSNQTAVVIPSQVNFVHIDVERGVAICSKQTLPAAREEKDTVWMREFVQACNQIKAELGSTPSISARLWLVNDWRALRDFMILCGLSLIKFDNASKLNAWAWLETSFVRQWVMLYMRCFAGREGVTCTLVLDSNGVTVIKKLPTGDVNTRLLKQLIDTPPQEQPWAIPLNALVTVLLEHKNTLNDHPEDNQHQVWVEWDGTDKTLSLKLPMDASCLVHDHTDEHFKSEVGQISGITVVEKKNVK